MLGYKFLLVAYNELPKLGHHYDIFFYAFGTQKTLVASTPRKTDKPISEKVRGSTFSEIIS